MVFVKMKKYSQGRLKYDLTASQLLQETCFAESCFFYNDHKIELRVIKTMDNKLYKIYLKHVTFQCMR